MQQAQYDECARRGDFITGAIEKGSENFPCALCGHAGSLELVKNNEVRVVICPRCSLAYLAPRLSVDGYARFYREYFQDTRRSLSSFEEAINRLARKDSYKKKESIAAFFGAAVRPGAKGVEIGAGWGTLAKVMQDTLGCSIDAVEPSVLAARVAHEHYGLTTFTEDGETFLRTYAGKRQYDFALLVHVFEHVLDPNAFLESIKRVLRPGGVLLLALPDLSRPNEPSDRYFHIEHTFYYTPTTLRRMLEKHGFSVRLMTQIHHEIRCIAEHRDLVKTVPVVPHTEERKIRFRLKIIDGFYHSLRFAKRSADAVLPKSVFTFTHSAAVRLLRKSGILAS